MPRHPIAVRFRICCYALLVVAGSGVAASAQSVKAPRKPKGPPKWTVEVHGGATSGRTSTSGTGVDHFPIGVTFFTGSNPESPASPTRSVPSWMFGDGTALFNEVNAQFAAVYGLNYSPIVPLDATLRRAGATRGRGASFGARIARALTPRISAEFSFDRSETGLTVAPDVEAAVNATRSSFVAGFDGLIRPASADVKVNATATIPESTGHQTSMSGVVNYHVWSHGRLAVHATGGIGVTNNAVNSADVKLVGSYQFTEGGLISVLETDTVTIRFTDKPRVLSGIFGGGVTRALSARGSLRIDARVFLSEAGLTTSVSASPNLRLIGPFGATRTVTNPSLQFSTQAGIKSSLSGAAIDQFTTFTGSGRDVRFALTVGYSVKF